MSRDLVGCYGVAGWMDGWQCDGPRQQVGAATCSCVTLLVLVRHPYCVDDARRLFQGNDGQVPKEQLEPPGGTSASTNRDDHGE